MQISFGRLRHTTSRRSLTLHYVLIAAVILGLLTALLHLEAQPTRQPPLTTEPAPVLDRLDFSRAAILQGEVGEIATVAEADVGMTLLTGGPRPVVSYSAGEPFVLASVAKVYILTAYLDLIAQGGRRPTESDMALMQAMIEVSDNRSASTLWQRIGQTQGLAAFLEKHGKTPIWTVEEDAAWGTLAASPQHVGDFLWDLIRGRLLDPESTQIAVAFLSQIDEAQRWGVSAGVTEPAATVMLKNGWYPETEGWRLNSAGIFVRPGTMYVLVVLSDGAETMEGGIQLIEQVAARANAYMAAGP